MPNLGEGFLWYLAFLFSIVVHEASHAFTAMKFGDNTTYEGGQVTRDPFPHIKREPVGTVAVPLLSYFVGGWRYYSFVVQQGAGGGLYGLYS